MIKQSITFEDFDGNTVTEDHYFHLSKSELIDMQLGDDSLSDRLQAIGANAKGADIIKAFKEIIEASYGQRVPGMASQFFKSEKISREFMSSLAFDAFLTTLLTDPQAAINFINGVMPKDLMATAEVQEAMAQARATPMNVAVPVAPGEQPVFKDSGLANAFDAEGKTLPWAFREPTQSELTSMHPLQMQDVYRRKNQGWTPPV